MTNLKAIATTCLAVTGLAMAQDNASTSTFPTPGSSSSSSSSVAAPRTGLYAGVVKGNAASDNTTDDYSRRPTLIGDRQYFAGYGTADLGSGAFSFKGNGMNWFGQMTGGGDPSDVRVGVGSGTAWGGGLLLSLDHTNVKNAAGETSTTVEGDGYGVFGDFNLGSSDVYGQLGWFTGFPSLLPTAPNNSVTVKPTAGAEASEANWFINLMAGWKKDATTEGTHSMNVEFNYTFGKNTTDPGNLDNSVNILMLNGYHGYILKAASDYAVFLGCNGGFLWRADKTSTPNVDASEIGINVMPNMSFQKQLGKGFEVFSGGGVSLNYNMFTDEPAGAGGFPPAGSTDASQIVTTGADVSLGLRWVKDNFAFEGSVTEALLHNGPQVISGTTTPGGMFAEVGMSLGI